MLKKQVIDLLHDIRPEFDFSASTDFIGDGMLDSFDLVVLVASLDKTFCMSIDGVDIVPQHFANIDTICLLLKKYGVKE